MQKNKSQNTVNVLASEELLRNLSGFIFFFYCIILIWVTIFKCNIYLSVTNGYHQFKTLTVSERFHFFIVPCADYFTDDTAFNLMKWKDGILNAVLFIPFGLYVSYFAKTKKLLKATLIALVVIVCIEIFQLYTLLGSLQTEDLILNLFGTLLGYLLCRLLYKKQNGPIRLTVLNLVSIVVVFVFVLLGVYAILNTAAQIDLYADIVARRL